MSNLHPVFDSLLTSVRPPLCEHESVTVSSEEATTRRGSQEERLCWIKIATCEGCGEEWEL